MEQGSTHGALDRPRQQRTKRFLGRELTTCGYVATVNWGAPALPAVLFAIALTRSWNQSRRPDLEADGAPSKTAWGQVVPPLRRGQRPPEIRSGD